MCRRVWVCTKEAVGSTEVLCNARQGHGVGCLLWAGVLHACGDVRRVPVLGKIHRPEGEDLANVACSELEGHKPYGGGILKRVGRYRCVDKR